VYQPNALELASRKDKVMKSLTFMIDEISFMFKNERQFMSYIRNILMLILASLLMACANTKTQRKVITPDGEPEWLYSPQSGCIEEKEICASGEGTNFKQSDSHAKKSLASIFETKINSSFQFTKFNFSDSEVSEMTEMVSNKIDEDVVGILKASYIKERFKKDDLMFSLAAIDKDKSGTILKQEIARIDDEINHYFIQRNRLFLKKLNVLYHQRELLNEKLVIINGSGINSPVALSQINMIKLKSDGGEKIKVISLNPVPELFIKKIEGILTDIGYKLNRENDNNFLLNIAYKEKEEYLNVPGFKKWSFEINIESKSNNGKRLGGYIISVVSDGRTKKDAYAKIRDKVIEEFEKNLDKLNLK